MIKTLPLNSRAKTTTLKQPRELFSYARDIDGEYVYDDESVQSAISYYYLPDSAVDSRLDLQSGYSKFKKIPEEQNVADFTSYLTAIQKHEESSGEKVQGDIVTFRGVMTKILALPFNINEPFDLNIVPFDGQLFMNVDVNIETNRREQREAELRNNNPPDKYEYLKKCEFSGYKFETIATLPRPWADCSRSEIEKRPKKMVNNYEQHLSVIKTGIGNVKLVLAGEIDCVWDYLPDDNKHTLDHYVELKTSRIIETNGNVVTFEKKLFKTWCQCFLMGVRYIIYGFRDDDLCLRNVEVFKTDEVPLLIKNNPLTAESKNKVNCVGALKWYGAVLEWLNTEIDKNDTSKSYRLSYDPGSKSFSLLELMSDDNQRLRNGEILTKEFKKWREGLV
ncbi:uncharacterized protein SPAPADRAFT_62675 [Spathaspora passalidarum NRRL Y-27907]|uniref:Decapping nuclease n=1 Tax=Spathaspora passalidarum (strain NRRL Y-27907 / 11-Y1) TaxID=619300 RepID=G3AT46_SPAPN|nr:uncharacterized protein SPAPADRAFT_62675 [Spathaspora passalidarum NRRL Y-27907]EGW30809.1 hypothetical protein SPAPADRAFT_62675 [Spathaspora passalidarum NRRL Y-27907]